MPRNLDRRVETIFPVDSAEIKARIVEEILSIQMRDNLKTRELQPDGSYKRLRPKDGAEPLNCQTWALERARSGDQ